MIEDIFIDDLKERNIEVTRDSPFTDYEEATGENSIQITCGSKIQGFRNQIKTKYLVGCDGARSMVRQSIPGAVMEGDSSRAPWGVLDGKKLAALHLEQN